jgi:hypothetical protein
MKTIRKRLTYANVISTLCLFLLLGGATAFAASKIGTNQLKGSSVTTGKIKKEAITTSKIKKGAVTGAKVNLGSLGTVPNATNATNAQPTAFAHVSAAGVLDAANSKNAGSVTKVGGGLYCFSGLPFAPRGGQATVDFAAAGFEYAQFEVGGAPVCPTGTQAAVFTTLSTGVVAAGFYVTFYQ